MQHQQQEPFLLNNLRKALSILYRTSSPNPKDLEEANTFLIELKSRNCARKIRSKKQQQQQQQQKNPSQKVLNKQKDISEDCYGSSWLACVVLLCSNDCHETERLFAAQTLSYRLRHMNIEDAIDFELEPFLLLQNNCDWYNGLYEWLNTYYPQLTQVIYFDAGGKELNSSSSSKKGTTQIITMISISILFVLSQHNIGTGADVSMIINHPFLVELGFALSIAATRIKYNKPHQAIMANNKKKQNNNNNTNNIPQQNQQNNESILSVLTSAYQKCISHLSILQSSPFKEHIVGIALCHTVSQLPDSLLGSIGGARGKLSLEKNLLYQANSEIRTYGTTYLISQDCLAPFISLACAYSSSSRTNNSTADTNTLVVDIQEVLQISLVYTFQKFAQHIPLNTHLVSQIVPSFILPLFLSTTQEQNIVNKKKKSHHLIQESILSFLQSIFDMACYTPEQILAFSSGISILSSSNHTSKDKGKLTGGKKGKVASMKNSASKTTKKRYEKRLNNLSQSENNPLGIATLESEQQKQVAMQIAIYFMSHFETLLVALNSHHEKEKDEEQKERILDVVCSCCSACLPYIIQLILHDDMNNNNTQQQQQIINAASELFPKMLDLLQQQICCSNSTRIRYLAISPIFSLYSEATSHTLQTLNANQDALLNYSLQGIFSCVMTLAEKCAYPHNYFHPNYLGEEVDEELERERNDIRDLLRLVTTTPQQQTTKQNNDSHLNIIFALELLNRIVQVCHDAVNKIETNNNNNNEMPSEVVLHALSALAKPLNKLTSTVLSMTNNNNNNHSQHKQYYIEKGCETIQFTMQTLLKSSQILNQGFATTNMTSSVTIMLPISRLLCIGIASLAPMFSNLLMTSTPPTNNNNNNENFLHMLQILQNTARECLISSIHMAFQSTLLIPEILHPFDVSDGSNDIRGAMHTPGGEDHVGALLIMRLCNEANICTHLFTNENDQTQFLNELSNLVNQLSDIEIKRGYGVNHGQGVIPKSKRILIESASRVAVMFCSSSSSSSTPPSSSLPVNVQNILYGMMNIYLDQILALLSSGQQHPPMTKEVYYYGCEACFSLAAFSNEILMTRFLTEQNSRDGVNDRLCRAIDILVLMCINGSNNAFATTNNNNNNASEREEIFHQFGRFRASLVTLFRSLFISSTSLSEYPEHLLEAFLFLIDTECKAITKGKPFSEIFQPECIGEDVLLGGAFIQVISEVLSYLFSVDSSTATTGGKKKKKKANQKKSIEKKKKNTDNNNQNTNQKKVTQLLFLSDKASASYKSAIFSNAVKQDFEEDPRPSTIEALYGAMNVLIQNYESFDGALLLDKILCESASMALYLILSKPIPSSNNNKNSQVMDSDINEKDKDNGTASLDGPQTLIMLDFLHEFLNLSNNNNNTNNKLLEKFGETQLEETFSAIIKFPTDDNINMHNLHNHQNHEKNIMRRVGALFSAVFLRGVSGSLPPWSIESIPELYKSLFSFTTSSFSSTRNNNKKNQQNDSVDFFCSMIEMSMDIQFCNGNNNNNNGEKGKTIVAGPFIQSMSQNARQKFLKQTNQTASATFTSNKNNSNKEDEEWRRFKTLIKNTCGGKKKETSYNLKPSYSLWECDRV